jgi:hypothetical protein
MNIRIFISALLIATATCIGQQTSVPASEIVSVAACPISITNIDPTGDDSMGHGLMSGNAHAKDGRMFVMKVQTRRVKTSKA